MERLLLQQRCAELKLRDISRGQNFIIVAPTSRLQRPTVYPTGATIMVPMMEIPLTVSTAVPLHQRFSPSYGGGINRQEGRSIVKPAESTTTLFPPSRNIVSPTVSPPSRVVNTTADSSNLHLPSTVKSAADGVVSASSVSTNLQSCMNNTNLTRQWINKNIKTIESRALEKGGNKKAEYSHNLMTSKSNRPVSSSKRFFRKRRTGTSNETKNMLVTKMPCLSTTPSQMIPPRNCRMPVKNRLAVADEVATVQSLLSMGGMKNPRLRERPIQRNEITVSNFLRTTQRN